jgi:hypothetical protein
MRAYILSAAAMFCLFSSPLYSAQSTITEADGSACMGDDKSRKQTEQAALLDAKKRAVEFVSTYVKSESEVKNFILEKDLLAAYAHAEVKVVQELSREWYKDPNSGDCLKFRIKAEVIPDTDAMEKMAAQSPAVADDPSAPLIVKVWSDKNTYKKGEKIKVYLKGNKPFYAKVLYKDAAGELVQILPNPHRTDNYFNGGTIYEIPSGGDGFELEVSPPFGDENIVVYASSAPLGEISTQTRGGVYQVKTKANDIGIKTRGIKLVEAGGKLGPAEFSEANATVKTGK